MKTPEAKPGRPQPMNNVAIKKYLSAIGARGGRAGRGKAIGDLVRKK